MNRPVKDRQLRRYSAWIFFLDCVIGTSPNQFVWGRPHLHSEQTDTGACGDPLLHFLRSLIAFISLSKVKDKFSSVTNAASGTVLFPEKAPALFLSFEIFFGMEWFGRLELKKVLGGRGRDFK